MKDSVYMTWAKGHAAATYNLANSGILRCGPADFPVAGEDLCANGANDEGYPPLKIAIARKYGLGVEGVVLAQGTSGANYLACATLLDAGDEVLVEQPTYEPILAAVGSLGAQVRRFPRSFEGRYQIDPDGIEKLLSPRTRMVILTSPHNPSGVPVEQERLRDLAGRCSQRSIYLLVDEVYRDILCEEAPPSAVHLGPFAVATSSLTKSYGLSGLRCGWILCGEEAAERMRRMNDLMGVAAPFPAEQLGCVAFQRLAQLEARSRRLIEPNLRLVHRFLEEHADLLDCVVPQRSMTVFPRLKLAESSDPLHDRLRRRDTSIVPGKFFEAPRHFRLGFAVATEDVAVGLSRLSETLREIS
jgi:aspartate/methionine/tyrosine aminotransferase